MPSPRPRNNPVFSAALLRPINIAELCAGLLSALTWAPWWVFPLSCAVYGLMVFASMRDRAFVAHVLRGAEDEQAGAAIDWRAAARDLGPGPWAAPLQRVALAERNLVSELALAPESARGPIASTLAQFRSAAKLAIDLAARLRSLDGALRSYAGMDADASRREAGHKRALANGAADDVSRKALLQAASALDESAATAEALRRSYARTAAQIESLSAMLESVAVRGVRLRLSDAGAGELTSTLGAEIDAVRETLSVLESMDPTDEARDAGELRDATDATGTRAARSGGER